MDHLFGARCMHVDADMCLGVYKYMGVYACVCTCVCRYVLFNPYKVSMVILFADKTTWAQRTKVESVSDSAWS